jgi:hypothetical protein
MMDDYYKHRRHGQHYMRLNQESVDPEGHATDIFTDWTINYLASERKKKQMHHSFSILLTMRLIPQSSPQKTGWRK